MGRSHGRLQRCWRGRLASARRIGRGAGAFSSQPFLNQSGGGFQAMSPHEDPLLSDADMARFFEPPEQPKKHKRAKRPTPCPTISEPREDGWAQLRRLQATFGVT